MRKHWKRWLFVFAMICCASLIALLVWIYSLNQEIQEKLAKRKFLPPTEFFTAPFAVSPGDRWTREELRIELLRRQYREIPTDRNLGPGQFWSVEKDECKKLVASNLEIEAPLCLILSPRENPDPEFEKTELKLQALAWGPENNLVLKTLQGNPLNDSGQVWLEPEVFAQYIGSTPVLQNWTSLGETPAACLNAVLAIEDSKFLEHGGVSFLGMSRALLVNLTRGRLAQGGSTITQQMVKNFFLSSERTLKRKLTEMAMSLLLEMHSNKDEIFETYLNIIYMGQSGPFEVRGFGAAARHYFNQDLSQLGLRECSLLAAILNSPGSFDPSRKPENAIKRRTKVLGRMRDLGMISVEDAALAEKAELPKTTKPVLWETAPYYIQAALVTLNQKGLSTEGLQIMTGLMTSQQEMAQAAVKNHIEKLESENPKVKKIAQKGIPLEGILLSLDLKNNWITAAVGGRSFRKTQYNRILDGHRQVGSLMKPFVFYTALRSIEGLTPLSEVDDKKFTYEYEHQSWSPENYGHKFEGTVPVYYALKKSLNAATAQLGIQAGLSRIVDNARKAGATSTLQPLPSLTLGAFELYPTEVLRMYSTLSQFGKNSAPIWVRSARYPNGSIAYQSEASAHSQELDPVLSAEVIGMMKQTVQSGSAAAIGQSGFPIPTAGKTGTTSDSRDAWFAGFTPCRLSVAWVGFDQNEFHGLTGASGAVPIWLDFMRKATAHDSLSDFAWPEGVRLEKLRPPLEEKEIELVLKK